MIRFYQLYLEYRRVGLGRLAALRFAWMVSGAEAHKVPVRTLVRR